jgi:hypothetical protein
MIDFIVENWAELLIAVAALCKVVVNLTPIVNLTPTEKDNQIFGWIDNLISYFIPDRRKK